MDGKEKESYCILLDGEGKREKARRSAITFEKNYSVDTCFIQADTGPFLSPSLSLCQSVSVSLSPTSPTEVFPTSENENKELTWPSALSDTVFQSSSQRINKIPGSRF